MNYKPLQFKNFETITGQFQEYFKDLLEVPDLYGRQVSTVEIQNIAPDLMRQFSSLGLNLDIARVFATPQGKKLPIHIDGSYDDQKNLAVNWPIANCTNTRMQWFKTRAPEDYVKHSDNRYGKGIKCYSDEECDLVEELELVSPAVVRINVPHTVVNYNKDNRIIISFRFYNNPEALWNLGTQ